MPPSKFTPGFLSRLKDKAVQNITDRVQQRLAPEPSAKPYQGQPRNLSEVKDQLKQNLKDRITELGPVKDKMLDPSAPLSDAVLQYRIRYCGKNQLKALVSYNKQVRTIDVYSFREGAPDKKGKRSLLLKAYCDIHGSIHSFKLDKFDSFIVTDQTYQARWPIEVA